MKIELYKKGYRPELNTYIAWMWEVRDRKPTFKEKMKKTLFGIKPELSYKTGKKITALGVGSPEKARENFSNRYFKLGVWD